MHWHELELQLHGGGDIAAHGAEACNYLLAVDVDMNTLDGFALTSWEAGYGDFVLRPEVMAGITNVVRYPNAVPASLPLVKPELKADTNVFPTPAQMEGFFTIKAVPQAAERARSRMWARFKAG